jgi:hypothetical protein
MLPVRFLRICSKALIGVGTAALLGCSETTAPVRTPVLPTATIAERSLRDLPRDQLWDWSYTIQTFAKLELDSAGVPVFNNLDQGARQPVATGTVGILMLSNAELLGNVAQRDSVIRWTKFYIADADTSEGMIRFPYNFQFALHGYQTALVDPPWYSALAQGEFLELLVRLHQVTGDQQYLRWADRVFAPFTDVRPYAENSRSVAHIDAAGYYWADEYPNAGRPDLTLNGFLYALRGVYEYWQVTKSPEARRVLLAGLTTIDHYAPQFRRPHQPSSYCLSHPEVGNGSYHMLIIGLFNDFYRVTGDAAFQTHARNFASDYWQ